jgi:MYXO-CTERM domain-containing protein
MVRRLDTRPGRRGEVKSGGKAGNNAGGRRAVTGPAKRALFRPLGGFWFFLLGGVGVEVKCRSMKLLFAPLFIASSITASAAVYFDFGGAPASGTATVTLADDIKFVLNGIDMGGLLQFQIRAGNPLDTSTGFMYANPGGISWSLNNGARWDLLYLRDNGYNGYLEFWHIPNGVPGDEPPFNPGDILTIHRGTTTFSAASGYSWPNDGNFEVSLISNSGQNLVTSYSVVSPTSTPSSIPEPTGALTLAGLLGGAAFLRRRRP